jgi:hypothetical protein
MWRVEPAQQQQQQEIRGPQRAEGDDRWIEHDLVSSP